VAGLLNLILFLLAAAGVAALVLRLLGALFRAGLAAAQKSHSDGLLEVSLRRGDLTALAERQAEVRTLRRSRTRSALLVSLWLGALAVPALAGVGREAYALASLLWLLPGRPVLPGVRVHRP